MRGDFIKQGSLKTRVTSFGLSDIGGRKSNQDSFFCNDRLRFYLVADGVGGHKGGDFASLFTSKKMNEILDKIVEFKRPYSDEDETAQTPFEQTTEDDFDLIFLEGEKILRHTLWFTNEELHRIAVERASEDIQGRKMGTTLIAAWLKDGQIIFMNVGDSRAYIIWEDNIQRVTHDHSALEEIIREGELSPNEAKSVQKRNVITRCLGTHPKVIADFYTRPLYPCMRILLCSDGLYDILPADEILRHCRQGGVEAACRELVSAAKDAGKKKVEMLARAGKMASYDNITALLIDVGGYVVRREGDNEPKVINEPTM